MVAAIVPDLDVLAFGLGIPYGDALGHRGMTHSLVFSLLLAGCGTFSARALHTTRWTAFAFLFLAVASHGLLDSFTNGGLGCALLWPFSEERFFMPWRGIEVSPIGAHFFPAAGWSCWHRSSCGSGCLVWLCHGWSWWFEGDGRTPEEGGLRCVGAASQVGPGYERQVVVLFPKSMRAVYTWFLVRRNRR